MSLLDCLCVAALARERVITCEEVSELAVSLSHMAEVSSPGGGWAQVATCRLGGALPAPNRAVEYSPMTRGLFGLPWVVWAALAFVVAAVFAFVAPGSAGTTGLQYVVLR